MYIRNVAKQQRKNAHVKAKFASHKDYLKAQVDLLSKELRQAEMALEQHQEAEQIEMYGMTRNWFASKARASKSWHAPHEARWYSVELEGYRLTISMTEDRAHWRNPVRIVMDAVSYVNRSDYHLTVYFPKGGSRRYTCYECPLKYRSVVGNMEKIMREYQIIEEA